MDKALRSLKFFITLGVLTFAVSACGGGGESTDPPDPAEGPPVGSLYSNGADWNDYIVNNGSNQFDATNTACTGAETGGYSACLHSGEIRAMEVTGYSSCTGLTATDTLGAFDWTCVKTATVNMVSTGLKDGKYLSDLIDFSGTPSWKSNMLTVSDGGTAIFTSPAGDWWSNTITVDNDGIASGVVSGTIYVVTTDPTATYTIDANKVALVIQPGVTLTGPGSSGNVITANTQNFLWIEGTIDATGDNTGVKWNTVKFSVLRNLDAQNADSSGPRAGVYLVSSLNNSLSNITASNNTFYGVWLESSSYNSLSEITAANSGWLGVYLYSSSDYNSLSNITASNNGTVGVQFDSSSNNSLSDITASDNGEEGVYLWDSSYNSLSDITAANNTTNGVYLYTSSNNTLSNVTAANNANYGVYIQYSSNNSLSDITASNNLWTGVQIYYLSSNNSLSNIIASNNLWHGVNLSSLSDNNTMSNITIANNSLNGVNHNNSSNNSLSDVIAANNGSRGVQFDSSSNNSLSDITAANNGSTGVWLISSSNNSLSNITAANNGGDGVLLYTSSDYNSLSNITSVNNLNQGVYLGASSNNSLSDITAANNASYGVLLLTSSNIYVTGLLKVGNNSSDDCRDDVGDTFSDANCTVVSPSDFTLSQGVTLASSFVGAATTDGSNTTSHTSGVANYDDITDWTSFDNIYRAWGKNASTTPTDSGNRGRGVSNESIRIWDWSMASADTVIKDVLSAPLTGNSANTITHTWSDTSTTTYLRDASEIMGDAIGNDNGLCEDGETCLYTPNIGSYQGHGTLQSAGSFTDGDTISDVTLMEYPTNGY